MVYEPGMLVKSKAGRDKDCIYVIIDVKAEYIYLADGRARTVCRTKKKNKKHLQAIKKIQKSSTADDETIRDVISGYLCLDVKEKSRVSNMQED